MPGKARDYLAQLPNLAGRLGDAPDAWSINEVGDGNLNRFSARHAGGSGVLLRDWQPDLRG